MSYKMEHKGKWGETHTLGGLNLTSDVGTALSISFGTRRETAEPTVRPVEVEVASKKGHHLVYCTADRAYYDYAPVHGRFYMGRCRSEKDAIARWDGWLRSQGVM